MGDAEWLSSIGGDKQDITAYIESAAADAPETENAPKLLRLPERVFLRLWNILGRKER